MRLRRALLCLLPAVLRAQAVERLRTAVLSQDHTTFVALMRRGRDYLEDRRSVAERRA